MTLDGTNSYVVGWDPCYVIDPGPDDSDHLDRILEEVESRGGAAGVVVTHSHADHAAGVGGLGLDLLSASGEAVGPFRVIPTPGHAADHVCLLLGRALFTGDLILGEGSTFVPPDGGSLAAYLDSLRRVQALDLEVLYPGHGPEVSDPQAKIAEYIDHRLDRERKLLAALDDGLRSEDDLLDRAWDDVPSELRPAAALTMRAHMEKLRAEGQLPADLA
jgi:glyoxylase-like metal-dependent hydrolase (beta-lactamase superfamily II)